MAKYKVIVPVCVTGADKVFTVEADSEDDAIVFAKTNEGKLSSRIVDFDIEDTCWVDATARKAH